MKRGFKFVKIRDFCIKLNDLCWDLLSFERCHSFVLNILTLTHIRIDCLICELSLGTMFDKNNRVSRALSVRERSARTFGTNNIICNWMGCCLLIDSKIKEVIFARDKWLQPNGLIFPDRATLYIMGIDDNYYDFDWWKNVYGYDMSCIAQLAVRELMFVETDPEKIVTNKCLIKEVDLYTFKAEDIDFKSDFKLEITRDDYIQAFVTYFNVEFTKCRKRTGFSTSPEARKTYWPQALFNLDDYLPVKEGEEMVGSFQMTPKSSDGRKFDISIDVNFRGELSELQQSFDYKM